MQRRQLLQLGRELGLEELKEVKDAGSTPTRARHHEYALVQLELVYDVGDCFVLTPAGERLANIAEGSRLKSSGQDPKHPDDALPEPVRAELREILCASKYVRHWWLHYFMPKEDFSLDEFIAQAKDVIIELVPLDQRAKLLTDAGAESEDAGHRLHSYFPQWPSLALDQAKRREIHQGLRQWSIGIDLVNELTNWVGWHPIEPQYAKRLEARRSKLDRLYVVQKHWNMEMPLAEFEALLTKARVEAGGGRRISIPHLIVLLAVEEHLSLYAIHKLLHRLYYERQDRYFFESASRHLLPTNPAELANYVQINGAWRTSLVFAA